MRVRQLSTPRSIAATRARGLCLSHNRALQISNRQAAVYKIPRPVHCNGSRNPTPDYYQAAENNEEQRQALNTVTSREITRQAVTSYSKVPKFMSTMNCGYAAIAYDYLEPHQRLFC